MRTGEGERVRVRVGEIHLASYVQVLIDARGHVDMHFT